MLHGKLVIVSFDSYNLYIVVFLPNSALTLSVEHKEEHPACKNLTDEVLMWLSAWSEMQIACIWSS